MFAGYCYRLSVLRPLKINWGMLTIAQSSTLFLKDCTASAKRITIIQATPQVYNSCTIFFATHAAYC